MQQIEMDFTRGDQLGLLDAVFFAGRSGCSTKAALKAIDSFGRECFASQKAIAERANMSGRTFQRALDRLLDLSIVTCDLKRNVFGVVTNHYRIVWNELQLRVDHQSSTARSVAPPVPTVTPFQQTDTTFGPTDTPSCRDRYDNMTHNTQLNHKNRHQPAREAAAGGFLDSDSDSNSDLQTLEAAFRSIGLQRFAKLAREFQGRRESVLAAIAVYSSQRSKFVGPGAVIDFLRSGSWPADGVLSVDELQKRTAAKNERRSTENRESIRCEVARDWKRLGRWLDATESEIDAEIERRLQRSRESSLEAVA